MNKSLIRHPDFDFIVTPKGGSPILGYEFAKLLDVPFMLHEESKRFHDKPDDMRTWFDGSQIPLKGATALIVDDSITGGTMVKNTIEHLRKYGYNVNTCYVIFEVCVKDGRGSLKAKNVELVSILQTHT